MDTIDNYPILSNREGLTHDFTHKSLNLDEYRDTGIVNTWFAALPSLKVKRIILTIVIYIMQCIMFLFTYLKQKMYW